MIELLNILILKRENKINNNNNFITREKPDLTREQEEKEDFVSQFVNFSYYIIYMPEIL